MQDNSVESRSKMLPLERDQGLISCLLNNQEQIYYGTSQGFIHKLTDTKFSHKLFEDDRILDMQTINQSKILTNS